MTGKVEYLERYSVAPSPSRDYYGLKILRDEVILCIWRISHGPHKTPILRRSKFIEFDQDKALQEDISRIFGNHFVNYIKSIASGKGNTLLTLPRSSIKGIVGYLKLKDIVNLCTLSRIANVVFSDNLVWEALYRRNERFRITRTEKEYAMAHGWKQAMKEKQVMLYGGHRKTQKATTQRDKSKAKSTTTRPASASFKIEPKVSSLSVNAESTKSSKTPEKDTTTSLLKLMNDADIDAVVKSIQADKKTSASVKKLINEKSRQTLKARSSKSEKSNLQLVQSKHNIREAFSDSMTATRKTHSATSGKLRKSSTKTGSTGGIKLTDKGKVGDSKKNSSIGKSKVDSISLNEGKGGGGGGGGGSGIVGDRQVRSKSRTKVKGKTKKSSQAKSTTSNVDKSFMSEAAAALSNENYELAFLIEESLKRLRSPRTVFDYDFSYLEGSRTLVNVTKKQEESARKCTSASETLKMHDQATTTTRTVDRSSDNSDSLDTPSSQSALESRRRGIEDNIKSKRSHTGSKVSTVRSEKLDRMIAAGDLGETPPKESPKTTWEDMLDMKGPIHRGALNSIDIMKSLRSINPTTKSSTLTSDITTTKNRFALKKKSFETEQNN